MKTIEKAANNYAYSREDNDYTIETEMAFMAGAKFVQQWIPVKEELPEELPGGFSDLVLTKNKTDNYHLERYDFENGYFVDVRYGGSVTHWRPIERE